MSESLVSSQQQPAAGANRPPVLRVNNIEVIYDHVILVLKGVSLEVPEGGIVALLGANGAGKTTTLKAISNLLHAERGDVTKGSIEFSGERVDRMTPNDLVRRGVIQVMEGRHCFEHLTIEENLLTGAYTRSDGRAEIHKDLGLEGFTRPFKVSCADHETGGPIIIQQWDGTKWSMVSDWIPTMRDVVRPMIEEAAAAYAKENNITPRDCT